MSSTLEHSDSLLSISNDLADAVARAGAATVAVHARNRIGSSGIQWRSGLIVTADHAVRRDDDISVTLPNGTHVPATLAGRDSDTDIAVLRIEAGATLEAPQFADAAQLRAGNLVLAVARDAEDGVRAASGVISSASGPWRTWRGGNIDRFIALDLSLYAGFSGGPLVDVKGRVLGMNTSALSRRFDLAIPNATVERVIEQLISGRRRGRAYIGLGLQAVRLSDALRRSAGIDADAGAIVVAVEPGGPAEKAGLFVGDIIIALDRVKIEDTDDILAQLGGDRVGTQVTLRVVRGGKAVESQVEIGERRADDDEEEED
ncbi:MAG: trypsin-like peptidase domain-containing protein [Candidatus Eremiobacteraeota bacterium]|nr:trypsin-like peptidase domain-containing protein [Candidatus Eremiobacteraeota bacterium]